MREECIGHEVSKTDPQCVMLIAGEASGDLHGARLVQSMREQGPDLYFCGIGGPAMAKAGVRILVDAQNLSVVGFTEVFEKTGVLIKGMMLAKEVLRQVKPDLLVLIDFPDFNLQVARTARSLGIKVLYYISPQIWAWRKGRVKLMKRLVDHVAVILPFEKEFYDSHGVPATYVGHPLLDHEGFESPAPPVRDPELIGLLPGSRNREVARHLRVMLDAAALMKKKLPLLRFVIPLAPTVDRDLARGIYEQAGSPAWAALREGGAGEVLQTSQLVIAASGTVTLEAALAAAPTVIIYKMSFTSYLIAKAAAQVEYVGLANLIGGKEIMPELIQHEATVGSIAGKALEILENPEKIAQIQRDLQEVKTRIGGAGASGKTARIALDLLAGGKAAHNP